MLSRRFLAWAKARPLFRKRSRLMPEALAVSVEVTWSGRVPLKGVRPANFLCGNAIPVQRGKVVGREKTDFRAFDARAGFPADDLAEKEDFVDRVGMDGKTCQLPIDYGGDGHGFHLVATLLQEFLFHVLRRGEVDVGPSAWRGPEAGA